MDSDVGETFSPMIYSAAHNCVLYETQAPLSLLAKIEGGKQLSAKHVAVPATLLNFQILARDKFPTPNPLDIAGYDWPIRAPWKPLRHQKITSAFLALHKRCCCLNDMGTMKTLSALWAADFIMQQYPAGTSRWIVECPISTMKSVWADEIFNNFLSRRKFAILHGSADKRLRELEKPADFYIVNPDGLRCGMSHSRKKPLEGFAKAIQERTDIRGAIADEASCYKDATTDKSRAAQLLLGQLEYLWLLTGTPTPNAPTDAYGLAKLLNNARGESFKSFKQRTMIQVSQFKWVPQKGAHKTAREALEPCIRYAIEDCVDLPPCTISVRDAEMSVEQTKAFKKLKNEACVAMEGGVIKAVNEAALRMKLIQIACGAVYDDLHQTHHLDASPRLAILDEVIEECAEKVIVFAPLTNVLKMVKAHLDKKGHACALINGSVSKSQRDEIFDGFQKGATPRILVADPGTMAHGLTLTAASTIAWYAATDKTELYLQANRRINRPGQTKHTNIVQIAASPIEREIYRRLDANGSMQGLILKLVKDQI